MKTLIIKCPGCKKKISLDEDDLSRLFNKPSVVPKDSDIDWDVNCPECGRIIKNKDTFQAYLDEG